MARRRYSPSPLAGLSPFRNVVADYAHNLLVGTTLLRLDDSALNCLQSCDLMMELARSADSPRKRRRQEPEEFTTDTLRRALRAYLRACKGEPRPPRLPDSPAGDNLRLIASLLELDEAQSAVLQFVLGMADCSDLRDLAAMFGDLSVAGAAAVLSAATAIPLPRVRAALSGAGRLVSSGILTVEEGSRRDLCCKLDLMPGVLDAVHRPGLDADGFLSRMLPQAEPSPLCWDDFEHLRAEVHRANKRRVPGIPVASVPRRGSRSPVIGADPWPRARHRGDRPVDRGRRKRRRGSSRGVGTPAEHSSAVASAERCVAGVAAATRPAAPSPARAARSPSFPRDDRGCGARRLAPSPCR